jgi:hypothetical protein
MWQPIVSAAVVAVAMLSITGSYANPYREALQAKGYEIKTVALPPARIGTASLRDAPTLAAEVLVEVQNYFPRALEPILLVDGRPAGYSAGIAEVRDDGTTVLRFIVEDASLLQEDASLAVQMGDDADTRGQLMTPLSRAAIAPLPASEAERLGLKQSLFEE